MNVEKKYGFRYMITGMLNGLYGIKDLEDGITEYYSLHDVINMSKIVKIAGVFNDNIDLNWFDAYFAKVKMVYNSGKLLAYMVGIELIDGEYCAYRFVDATGYYNNMMFLEFLTGFTSVVDDYGSRSYRQLSVLYTEQAMDGIGFPRVHNVKKAGRFSLSRLNDKRVHEMIEPDGVACFEDYNGNLVLDKDSKLSHNIIDLNCKKLALLGIPDNCYLNNGTANILFLSKNIDFSNIGTLGYITLVLERGIDLFSVCTTLYSDLALKSFRFKWGRRNLDDCENFNISIDSLLRDYIVIDDRSVEVTLTDTVEGFYVTSGKSLDNIHCSKGFYNKFCNESSETFKKKHNISKRLFLRNINVGD